MKNSKDIFPEEFTDQDLISDQVLDESKFSPRIGIAARYRTAVINSDLYMQIKVEPSMAAAAINVPITS